MPKTSAPLPEPPEPPFHPIPVSRLNGASIPQTPISRQPKTEYRPQPSSLAEKTYLPREVMPPVLTPFDRSPNPLLSQLSAEEKRCEP
jgi:hypothetical protein